MKTTTLYDFTLTAGGSFVILADADMYKVLTATGDISVTRDGGATIKPLRAGRGERRVPFQRLVLRDLSGSPNSGTILVGDSDFIDDTIVISSAINVRPEAISGSFSTNAAVVANTPETVFTAAANTGGAIIFDARFALYGGAVAPHCGFISKATAPTGPTDGVPVCLGGMSVTSTGGGNLTNGHLAIPQLLPAGHGLFFISDTAVAGGNGGSVRNCRYKLL